MAEAVVGSRWNDVIRGDDQDNDLHGSGGDDVLEVVTATIFLTGDFSAAFSAS